MKYWDSSAIVALLVEQARTVDMTSVIENDPEMTVWWETPVECFSALMRLVREGALTRDGLRIAEERLNVLGRAWEEVAPGESCRRLACRMLRVHALRAGDAMQLAAATVAAENDPTSLEIVCLDTRLAEAARIEGFSVVG